jgi:glycosyltransferase involved in cell wall biosynthesis
VSRRWKVLYIVTAYSRDPDDVITPWLVETIERLGEVGVDVEVLAPAYRGLGDAIVHGVPVHRFRYAPRRWEDLTHDETAPDRVRQRPGYLALVPGYVLCGMGAARRLVRRCHFDIVHVHWPLPHALLGLAAQRAARVPLVCSFYGVELTWARRFWPFRLFLRRMIRRADAVTAISTYTAGLIRQIHERRVELIPFGATVDPGITPVESRREVGRPFELLFVGRLVERKGVRYLLDAIAQLQDRYDVLLRVVGDGPWRSRLEAHARTLSLQDRVRFEGFVSKDELARRFAGCDAFVLPAVVDAKGDTEGLGVVLIEALSYGKPVVATSVGGIVDIVRDGETGLLVPPEDADALARAIATYIEEPERARTLADSGRAHVDAQFSWPTIIDRLTSLYRELTLPRVGERPHGDPSSAPLGV